MTEKNFMKVLAGESLPTPPIWLMRQAGRYLPEYREVRASADGFLDLCYTPEKAAEVTLQPIRRYDLDAAILFSDILVVPDALGQKVWFVEGEGPKLDPITGGSDVAALSTSWVRQRMALVFETIGLIKKDLPSHVSLIGFSGAPWTVATYMIEGGGSRDFAKAKAMLFENRECFDAMLEILIEGTADYLIAQIEAGVDALQIFDTWASALDDDEFDHCVIQPTKRIVEIVRSAYPGFPIIGFPRGAGVNYVRYQEETGVTAVSLDTGVSLDWAASVLQKKTPVQGNLDPQLLLAGGDGLKTRVERICEKLSGGPHIFNLGHGIIKETPPEHVSDLISYIRGS